MKKVADIEIDGLATVFIYEEFHPSNQLDIEQDITDFISEMLGKNFQDYLHIHLAETCRTHNGEPLSAEAVVDVAIAFSARYDQFRIKTITDFGIEVNEKEETASVTFDISYSATKDGDKTSFKGRGTALMAKGELGYWNIVKMKMPGFFF